MAGKLRHLAFSVQDTEAAAAFYEKTFGMERIRAIETPSADVVYISDGVMNLALIHYKTEEMAAKESNPHGFGKEFVGLHHIGFWVDDLDAAKAEVEAQGASYVMGEPASEEGAFYEVKYRDPNGILFDITHNGWDGAVKDVPAVGAASPKKEKVTV